MKSHSIESVIHSGDGHQPLSRSAIGSILKAAKAYKLKGEPTRMSRHNRLAKRKVGK